MMIWDTFDKAPPVDSKPLRGMHQGSLQSGLDCLLHRGWTHPPSKTHAPLLTNYLTDYGYYCIVGARVPMTAVPVPRSFLLFDGSHQMSYPSAEWPHSY